MLKLSFLGCLFHLAQAETTLDPGSPMVLRQESAIQSFVLWPDFAHGEHWYVEVDFSSSRLPDPVILSGNWKEALTAEEVQTADFLDFTGWYQHKSFHHLSLPVLDSAEVPFHIAIYLNLTPAAPLVNYSLVLLTSETPICARNCSGHGLCQAGQCLCRDGYGDELCDVLLLDLEQEQSLIVTSGQVWYLQVASLQNRKAIFEWTDGFPSIMTKNRGCDQRTALPSVYEHTDWYVSTSNQGSYVVQSTDAKCTSQAQWTFRVAQSTNDPVVLIVRMSGEESGGAVDIMVIVIGVVGSLVGLAWVIFITWKIYARCHRKHVVVADLVSASLLKMRKLCPKQRFRSIPSPSEHPCAICLEEFTPQSDVRVLPCGHIYHEVCIDQWFLRNQSCCFCKMDVFLAKEIPEMQVNDTSFSIAAID